MKTLSKTEFGNPVLRAKVKKLSEDEILSAETQELIANIRHTLIEKKYGVGLAAPQVGRGISLSVIHIRPTKMRPNLPKSKWVSLVIINPKITKTYGQPKQYWEGCISLPNTFAKVPRYKKVKVKYLDEKGVKHEKVFEGLLAHVLQHEIDHLNGGLFVDKVMDTRTYMTAAEYKKRIVKKEGLKQYDSNLPSTGFLKTE